MQHSNRRGLLIILSSPSGAGKTTLARRLTEWDSSIVFSVSATTRPPRTGEVDGREYFFRTKDEFRRMVRSGEFLEHAEVFGNSYGSPREPVDHAIRNGLDVVFDIDWQGGQQIKSSAHATDTVGLFVLPPSITELRKRLKQRGKDSARTVNDRMSRSKAEIEHWTEYDYVLINNDVDEIFEEIQIIVRAERLKRTRQRGLEAFVACLDHEFERTPI